MKRKTVAIQSTRVEKAIGNALRNRREIYYLIYRLAIETGMNVQYILNLKVHDVKDRHTFFVPSKNVDKGSGVQETISEELYDDIQRYIKDHSANEWFALNLRGNDNINVSTIQKNLIAVTQDLHIEGIGLSSFRKTYLYHKILSGTPISIIRRQIDLPSIDSVYTHLGITNDCFFSDKLTKNVDSACSIEDNPAIVYYIRKEINNNLQYIIDCIVDKTLYGETANIANNFVKDLFIAADRFSHIEKDN